MKWFFNITFLLLLASPVHAGKFLKKCPCGPDAIKGPIRLLIMQGSKGGDFRKSCVRHDNCYSRLDSSQRICDTVFLSNLLTECEKKSWNPKKCRRKARFAYWLVSKFGKGAYRKSIEIAKGKTR